jgi:competence protein ComEC
VIIFDPAQVESIGCWMSFGSVGALIGWMPVWNQWLGPHHPRIVRWVWASLGTTTVATMGTLPVTAWIFQSIGLGAPLANLVAIPLFAGVAVPTAMIGFHGPDTGADTWLRISDATIGWSMTWMKWADMGSLAPAIGPISAAILGISVLLYRRPRWALLLAMIAFVQPSLARTDFEITFPAIGQGGAALVSFPDGRRWLIDGGPPGNRLLHWLRRNGIRKLDAVFLTHPDIDHLGGLIPVIQSIQVNTLWAPRRPLPTENRFHALWRDANQKGVHTAVFGPPSTSSDNDNSLVVRLRHGKHQFLLTGDIGITAEHRMVQHLEQMTVVQIPHHGSKSSSSEQFIAVTDPLFAVAQAGKQNRYGHPHPSVVERWGPDRCLRTDQDGTIRFTSDGEKVSVFSWIPRNGWRNRTEEMIGSR